jgi:hypothetical protein
MIHFSSSSKKESLPNSLEGLSLKLRDIVKLRLADVKDIDALATKVETSAESKDTMENWYLIALGDKSTGTASVVLVGDSAVDQRPKVTSPLVAIDFEKGVAITHSQSSYAFGNRGFGELAPNLLQCLEAAIRTWDIRKTS